MARQGRWQDAVTDAALPSNINRLTTSVITRWLRSCDHHNHPAYEQLCRRILATFADTTNAYVAIGWRRIASFFRPRKWIYA